MQAITVKFLAPTNTRGARLKAECNSGSIIVGYPYGVRASDVHRFAANALCEKFNWGWRSHRMVEGILKNGDSVFVFVPTE